MDIVSTLKFIKTLDLVSLIAGGGISGMVISLLNKNKKQPTDLDKLVETIRVKEIEKIKDDLSNYKLYVAERYIKDDDLKEIKTQIIKLENDVFEVVNGLRKDMTEVKESLGGIKQFMESHNK